ncbi:MAG: hypothetical protein WCW84_00690 [Sulfurimonas sp.]|jgi:hypothetical protein
MITAKIVAEGTVFTAVSVNTKNRSDQELSVEQISLEKPSKDVKSDFVYMTKESSGNGKQTVVFNDAQSDQKVALTLDNKTIEKLKTHFGSDDVYARSDGIVRLDNKAEAFVSGWFADVAYKREVLGADQNNDGKIDDQEYRKTKSFVHGYIEIDMNHGSINAINDVVTENYADGSRLNPNDYMQHLKSDSTNLDTIVGESINTDTNYDGNIGLDEMLKFVYKTGSTAVAVAKDAKDLFGGNLDKELGSALDGIITSTIHKKKETDDEEKKKMEALQKLIASGGNVSALSADEKVLLQNELAKYTKTNEKYDTKELQGLQETMQKVKEYKDTTSEEKLGLYYQERG